MRLAKWAAGLCGALLAFFGLLYVLFPERMLGYAELVNLPPSSLTDLRVMYGALQVAPGLFMLASVRRTRWLEPALALGALSFAWIAALRLFGMAHDGSANQYHLTAIAIEIPTCAFAAFAWRGLRAAGGA